MRMYLPVVILWTLKILSVGLERWPVPNTAVCAFKQGLRTCTKLSSRLGAVGADAGQRIEQWNREQ